MDEPSPRRRTWDRDKILFEREAREVLQKHLEGYRARSYAALKELLGQPSTEEVRGASGDRYYLEVEVSWDNRPGGALRVMGTIDDGWWWWRAIRPLSTYFIVAPDGSFIGG